MDQHLVTLAQQQVKDGFLPAVPASRTDGGRSSGNRCSLCSQVIEPDSHLICIHWEDSQKEMHQTPLHPNCHAVWLTLVSGSNWSRQP
jgi:hypothetical protein